MSQTVREKLLALGTTPDSEQVVDVIRAILEMRGKISLVRSKNRAIRDALVRTLFWTREATEVECALGIGADEYIVDGRIAPLWCCLSQSDDQDLMKALAPLVATYWNDPEIGGIIKAQIAARNGHTGFYRSEGEIYNPLLDRW